MRSHHRELPARDRCRAYPPVGRRRDAFDPNGIPLRRDLHRLFDLGYVTIRPDMRFAASRRLRDEYANGRAYHERDGRTVQPPESDQLRPDPEVLAWHGAELFRDH